VLTGTSRWVWLLVVDPIEEPVVDGDERMLIVFGGVVASVEQDGDEFGSAGEVDAGFAHGFEGAVLSNAAEQSHWSTTAT
jgi:hypothetical protein